MRLGQRRHARQIDGAALELPSHGLGEQTRQVLGQAGAKRQVDGRFGSLGEADMQAFCLHGEQEFVGSRSCRPWDKGGSAKNSAPPPCFPTEAFSLFHVVCGSDCLTQLDPL